MTINLLDQNRQAMEAFFAALGEKAFRASQVMKWIYHHGVDDFDAMSNLSKALRDRLKELAEIRLPEVAVDKPSRDGTRKWMLRLADGNSIEMVYIPETDRSTLCVSSQVGCALNCSFCSTARQGYNRNLTTAEIIGQVVLASRLIGLPQNKGERVISNVVLMGMGEPLLNFDAVVKAMELMQDDYAFGISKRRVTVSTAGVVPAIDQLRAAIDVSLAVSLHAPDDALRNELVPINTRFSVGETVNAAWDYARVTKRRVSIEYAMMRGINDQAWRADLLADVLPARGDWGWVHVNLIPLNPTPGSKWTASDPADEREFVRRLEARGIPTTVRDTRGREIDGACGQLAAAAAPRQRGDARGARADAPAHRRVRRRLAHARMIRQPECVARAQQEHRPPFQHHARALWPADHAHAAVEAGRLELVQPLLQVLHALPLSA